MDEKYKFVQSIDYQDDEKIAFTVRNIWLSDIKSERTTMLIFRNFFKIFCIFMLFCLMFLMMFVPFMFIFFILNIFALLWLYSQTDENIKINLSINRGLNRIDFIDHLSNKNITIYNPQKIKITARVFSEKNAHYFVSVDIFGTLDLNEKNNFSNIRLTSFRYRTLKNAKERVNVAAIEFGFLSEWLKIPMLTEKDAYYYDTNCRVF